VGFHDGQSLAAFAFRRLRDYNSAGACGGECQESPRMRAAETNVGDFSMGAMDITFAVLALVSGLATMVFFVVVLVEMFKRQQTAIAIACIVLFLTTLMGGPLVAFVYGWIKVKEWSLQKNMLAWTGCLAVCLISAGIWGVWTAARAQSRQQRLDHEMQQQIDVEELKVETH
jgi:hypothetical protein